MMKVAVRTGSGKLALSAPRMGTYEKAVASEGDYIPVAALGLYDWNAQVAGAFMAPLHICEVVTRSAVSEALTAVYGANWPWSPAFERSLPSSGGYDPRRDLQRNRVRLWNPHLMRVLLNLDRTKTIAQLRGEIYDDLKQVRLLRNRIADHEPIFKRDLRGDFDGVTDLIRFRCVTTATWMTAVQRVTQNLPR